MGGGSSGEWRVASDEWRVSPGGHAGKWKEEDPGREGVRADLLNRAFRTAEHASNGARAEHG